MLLQYPETKHPDQTKLGLPVNPQLGQGENRHDEDDHVADRRQHPVGHADAVYRPAHAAPRLLLVVEKRWGAALQRCPEDAGNHPEESQYAQDPR